MTIERALIWTVAGATHTDPRSVVRVLRGERVRGDSGIRIARALAERGITPPPLAANPNPPSP